MAKTSPCKWNKWGKATPGELDAGRRCIGDWDGVNWEALYQFMRNAKRPAEELDRMERFQVEMALKSLPITLRLDKKAFTETRDDRIVVETGDEELYDSGHDPHDGQWLTPMPLVKIAQAINFDPRSAKDILRKFGLRQESRQKWTCRIDNSPYAGKLAALEKSLH